MHPVEWMRETAAIMNALSSDDGSSSVCKGGGARALGPVLEALADLEADVVQDQGFVVFLLRDSGFSDEEVMGSIGEIMKEWQLLRRSLIQGTRYLQ